MDGSRHELSEPVSYRYLTVLCHRGYSQCDQMWLALALERLNSRVHTQCWTMGAHPGGHADCLPYPAQLESHVNTSSKVATTFLSKVKVSGVRLVKYWRVQMNGCRDP